MDLFARAALNLAAFITVGSVFMLAATKSGTAERSITLFTLTGGLIVIAVAVIVLWRHRRNSQHLEDQ
jgi:glycerol-3-phosphate acyltransferase PlsY